MFINQNLCFMDRSTINKLQNLILILLFLVGFTSCSSKENGAESVQAIKQEASIQTFIDDFLKAFNNADISKIDELSASPFVFYVGGKLSSGNTYGAIVDFDAIKSSGWKYTKINASKIFYEDLNSSQVNAPILLYKPGRNL